jgi:putative transposase
LEVLLDVAGLPRSTFFYHQSRLQGPDPRASLKAAITEIFEKSRARYGHRRVQAELTKQGWKIAKKTVLKLMCSLRLVCKVRRKKRYNSYQGEQGVVAPNLLKRQFDADAPNEKWVTDVTEFSVGDQKLYLSPVMDLFDRQIISYAIGSSPNLELANASLREALATLKDGQKPLVHSDYAEVIVKSRLGSLPL